MYFYVPFTQLAVVITGILYIKATTPVQKIFLKKAGIFGILGILISIPIITQINLKLFFGDLDKFKDQLKTLSVIWLIGNAVRLYLVGNSLRYAIKAYLDIKIKSTST